MIASHLQTSKPSELTPQDTDLIHHFVDGFLQGNSILLSTQHLRTEPLFDSLQLIAHRGGLIATAYLYEAPIRAIIRQSSPYWLPLHEAMVSQQFYPVTHLESSNQYIYRHCNPPEGYTLQCTSAKELWRACWGRGFSLRSGIPLDLLVWGKIKSQNQEKWHSLRGIDCVEGQLQAKVLGGRLIFAGTDWVVWTTQKHGNNQTQQYKTPSHPHPSLRGYYRLRH